MLDYPDSRISHCGPWGRFQIGSEFHHQSRRQDEIEERNEDHRSGKVSAGGAGCSGLRKAKATSLEVESEVDLQQTRVQSPCAQGVEISRGIPALEV